MCNILHYIHIVHTCTCACVHVQCITFVCCIYAGLSQRSNPGREAVDVKGAESVRSSLTVTCSGSSSTRGPTGMKYHTRNKTGRYKHVVVCCICTLCVILQYTACTTYMHIYNIHARYMYTGLYQTSNPGTEAVDVKGAEIDRSSLRVTCSGSSPTRGPTGMKYHTRNKTGR